MSIREQRQGWSSYSLTQKKNIAIWIAGIMFYKLGLETFQGSITIVALERWGDEKHRKYGLLRGLDQLFQCIGSILVAPLIRRFPTRNILIFAATVFGLLSAILMIIDVSSGGRMKVPGDPDPVKASPETAYHGSYSPDVLFPIMCASGIVYGMIELIRRVIPRDIVGGDIGKLRQMDALVHILYEVAGTAGAFMSWALMSNVGSVYGLLATPTFFAISSGLWFFLGTLQFVPDASSKGNSYLTQVGHGVKYFGLSIYQGASIIFSNRKFIWLPIGYSLALYGHRYLENGILPIIAEDMLHNPAYSRILVCGSNLGELLGALTVFLFGNLIPTPIPWLRLDALLLLLLWVLPFYLRSDPTTHTRTGPAVNVKQVWRLTALFIPISFGWAGGDVSLGAYIQESLPGRPRASKISSLGAVMAFLYSTYIITFAIMSPALGAFADGNDNPRVTLLRLGAVQFTVLAVLLLGSTFVPRGAGRVNPELREDEELCGWGGEGRKREPLC